METQQNSPAGASSNTQPSNKQLEQNVGKAVLSLCGLIVLVVFVVSVIKGTVGGPNVTMEGTTAKMRYDVDHTDSAFGASRNLAANIYSAAKENPKAERIEVRVFMSPKGVTDEYGNEPKEPMDMGFVEATDLDEIRKFKNGEAYWEKNHEWYVFQLNGLKYSHLFSKY